MYLIPTQAPRHKRQRLQGVLSARLYYLCWRDRRLPRRSLLLDVLRDAPRRRLPPPQHPDLLYGQVIFFDINDINLIKFSLILSNINDLAGGASTRASSSGSSSCVTTTLDPSSRETGVPLSPCIPTACSSLSS